ncbi:MAG: sigma 54-interacting transcriptional regulator [Firmicutes bacterium]|nr:sigma 54-interacting transcriptional regulator [Bacillota bacterium]
MEKKLQSKNGSPCETCCYYEEKRMDILFEIMDNENDVTLTDGKGIVLRVSDSYEEHFNLNAFGLRKEDVIGKTVWELEEMGVFSPSVTSVVLEEKKNATIIQKNKKGENLLVTGIPIFGNQGEISYVVSFNSLHIAGTTSLQSQYERLNAMMQEYNQEINKLRLRDLREKEFINKSKSMENISELISQIADTNASVLITGETGVGKSMIAKMIHESSNRAEGPFVEINCGTIPENLMESELFGYEKGSFTGANSKGKMGKIELARGGTLFLDEIGEISLNLQIKFLQVIQEKMITRVGGLSKIEVDFRLITATNRNLDQDIQKGVFREDLFYRLNVIPIHIPPLRERREDVLPLIMHFLERFNSQYGRNVALSAEALQILERQVWPGNIRQVENLIERLVVTARSELIRKEELPDELEGEAAPQTLDTTGELKELLENYERKIFVDALKKYKTSVAVAKALGIGQTTAARKLRKYIPGYANLTEKDDSPK